MNNTKAKILSTSLDLFNTYGLAKVTLRTIAKEMNISQGNLNYHFKKREDIIEALYFDLVKKIDAGIPEIEPSKINISVLIGMSNYIMKSSFDYRFFLLDFVLIIRENQTIKLHYANLVKQRQQQFGGLIMLLVQNDLMRPEKLNNEYELLIKRFHILGDFWISSAKIYNKKITKNLISEYSEILIQSIFPYLTLKGEKEYQTAINKSK